jgi:beta-lactamase superfamily II metal-dependent hydrolase
MPGLWNYYVNVLGLDLAEIQYIDADLVVGRLQDDRLFEMAWGDAVRDVVEDAAETTFRVVGGSFNGTKVRVKGALPLRDTPLLRISMIDVQQGDGLVIETSDGQLVLMDGGDNQLFARHIAARFHGTTEEQPLEVDAIIVTHGDADHFEGLAQIVASESLVNTVDDPRRSRKRVFLHPVRVLHNGLVKAPSTKNKKRTPDDEMLGDTTEADDRLYVVRLVDRPDEVDAADMNNPFRSWVSALAHWDSRREQHGLEPARIERLGTDVPERLGFLADGGLRIDLFGPQVAEVGGAPALPFLRRPRSDPNLHLPTHEPKYSGYSASHTINGHSIAFRLQYGNVRFMLTGDLNRESMEAVRRTRPDLLEAEVLKVPHHGSHDFDYAFLQAVGAAISLISSGDESADKEHIHPRATLVGALGRAARSDLSVVFITELAAFFRKRGDAVQSRAKTPDDAKPFFAFERTNFGIVHLRTDGERLLAFTHSGEKGTNEAYAFSVGQAGQVAARPVSKVSAPAKTNVD